MEDALVAAAAVKEEAHSRDACTFWEGSEVGGCGTGAAGGEEEMVAGVGADKMWFGFSINGGSNGKSGGGTERKSGDISGRG